MGGSPTKRKVRKDGSILNPCNMGTELFLDVAGLVLGRDVIDKALKRIAGRDEAGAPVRIQRVAEKGRVYNEGIELPDRNPVELISRCLSVNLAGRSYLAHVSHQIFRSIALRFRLPDSALR